MAVPDGRVPTSAQFVFEQERTHLHYRYGARSKWSGAVCWSDARWLWLILGHVQWPYEQFPFVEIRLLRCDLRGRLRY